VQDVLLLAGSVLKRALDILLLISDDPEHHDDIQRAVDIGETGWQAQLGKLLDELVAGLNE
jgi:DNA-binding PadR family transcriptional regulator